MSLMIMQSIYVMKSNGKYKIGISSDVDDRLKGLMTGNPDIKLIYASDKIYNARKLENKIHHFLRKKKIYSEWFKIKDELKLIEKIEELIEEEGIKEYDEDTEGFKSRLKLMNDTLDKLFNVDKYKEEMEELEKETEINIRANNFIISCKSMKDILDNKYKVILDMLMESFVLHFKCAISFEFAKVATILSVKEEVEKLDNIKNNDKYMKRIYESLEAI